VSRALRVAVVTESFLPQVNGVTNSVCRVLEHLDRRGHDALLIAPSGGLAHPGPSSYAGYRVLRAPSAPLPLYPEFRVAMPWTRLASVLREYRPDVVHLADPTVLGAQAARIAARLGVPSVAVYQTDLAGFAARYGLTTAERAAWRWRVRVHALAGRTLAPSRSAEAALCAQGVQRVHRWVRGVDAVRFDPAHRSDALRARLAPDGEVIVGYVGRLAAEKRVHQLEHLTDIPGVRVVVVGDGPLRSSLERRLPRAQFLGFLGGTELSTAYASLDMFVHTGADETFCQAAQEAKASGVPVVAPAAGGLLDLVEPGRTGLLYRPDDTAGLRAAVATLADDAAMRTRMGLAARRSVAGRDWESVGDELIEHYAATCGRTPLRTRGTGRETGAAA
jgi:phosphatidylinositol alpha 1,6-mannosyltransferase